MPGTCLEWAPLLDGQPVEPAPEPVDPVELARRDLAKGLSLREAARRVRSTMTIDELDLMLWRELGRPK